MKEQVMIYEIKSGAHANAEKLYSPERKHFYWNQKFFRMLQIGDFVFVVDRNAPSVLFTRLDKTDIPTTNSSEGASFSDEGVTFQVSGQWDEFIRLQILQELIPPAGWEWKSLGSAETVYLKGPRINPDYAPNRLLNIEQLKSLSDDSLFQEVLSQSHEEFSKSNILIPAILNALQSPSVKQLLNETDFHFEKAREQMAQFESFPGSTEFFAKVLQEFISANKTFTDYLRDIDDTSDTSRLFRIIGGLISYLDRNAANKIEYNQYADKRTLARSGVRQNTWVDNLLRYRINQNSLDSLTSSTRNALAYLQNPSSELTMLSENHRKMLSKNLLKKPAYVKETFLHDVLAFFAPYNIQPANDENLTRVISNILYEFPRVKQLWFEGEDIPEPRPPEEVKTVLMEFANPYRSLLTAIKTKPFLLFAGLSGTGKSRLVRTLAYQTCSDSNLRDDNGQPGNFQLIPVKPNWHDSADLMGYVSRINGEKYVTTAFLKFIAKAWKYPNVPFFLCLDEMNLAPVEQYFAEYLSVIETRTRRDGVVSTDYFLAKSEFENPELYSQILADVGISNNEDFVEGVSLPKNLVVVGTVNMDETTHSFSRKVLDRAMTFEMNKVDLTVGLYNVQDDWSYPAEYIASDDVLGSFTGGSDVVTEFEASGQVLDYLIQVNEVLHNSPFKIAYRVRDEFLIYCYYASQFGAKPLNWLDIAMDEMTAMKILSRIEGDEAKTEKVLSGLDSILNDNFTISKAKLNEMNQRLQSSGYTSFWS